MLSLPAIVLSFLALSGPSVEVRSGGLIVECRLEDQTYFWTVTNEVGTPIRSMEIDVQQPYTFEGPEGWTVERSGGRVRCATDDPRAMILPGRTAEFHSRVNAGSAALGTTTARFMVGRSDEPVDVPGVWTAVFQPRSHILLIAGTLAALALLHTVLGERRDSPRRHREH